MARVYSPLEQSSKSLPKKDLATELLPRVPHQGLLRPPLTPGEGRWWLLDSKQQVIQEINPSHLLCQFSSFKKQTMMKLGGLDAYGKLMAEEDEGRGTG